MRNKILLSKSKVKQNDQCEKMLWLEINKRDVGVWDSSDQAKFNQGREVEQIMRDQFPNGKLMDKIANEDKIVQTNLFLKENAPVIFEAAFFAKNTIIQIDALINNNDGTHDAVEVKSGGSFKPDYLDDTTIQFFITEKSGKVKIRNYYVWHVNKTAKSAKAEELFTKVDVTMMILQNREKFDSLHQKALETAMLKKEPVRQIGSHCSKPYTCKFWNYCSQSLNQKDDSVLNLPYFPNKYQAIEKGIDSVNHPEFDTVYKYTEQNPEIVKSIRENRLVINQEGVTSDLAKWKYPLNFFDFETLMSAIPILEGQKPFQQLVFQHSTHVLQSDLTVKHYEFLHGSLKNPNKDVIESMLNALDNEGSIVSYNKSFEMSRIKELAINNPEYKTKLLALLDRFVDLMDIVKDHVYHPKFRGSYSLKSVSPALLGYENGGYTDSIIKNGGEISKYYAEYLTTTDMDRRVVIEKALLKYCKYDTTNLVLLMVWLLDQNTDITAWVNKTVLNVETSTHKVEAA